MADSEDVATRTVDSGVSAGLLGEAIAQFTAALGAEKVLTSADDVAAFRDPFSHASWDEYTASAVVMPTTVEEVQAVVRVANTTGVPLWTHSQGRNNGYGGPAPRVKGSVIVSLRNMNRVLEIDETLGYAVVEPGVRWFDLYEAIQARGAKLMASIADIGWGSVIGNTLEHGATYLPYGLDFQAQCGMEVVLPDGDLLRTGMGAMPENRAWHLYRRGLGPTPDQMFMQSNFGIVTKMGVWLMPQPEVYMPLWLRLWNDDDIGPALDVLRELMMDDTIRMVPQIMSTILLGSVFSSRDQWYTGEGAMPDDIIDRMGKEMECGRWLMRFALFGDEAVVDHRFAKIKHAFETRVHGAEVWGTKHDPSRLTETVGHPGELVGGGVPTLELNAQTAWYGGEKGGHVGFSPILPMTGNDGIKIRDLLRGMVEDAGLDYIAAWIPLSARSIVHVTLIIFDTENEGQTRAAYDVSRRLVVEAGKLGYGEYRAHLDFMDLAVDQYRFNDHATIIFFQRSASWIVAIAALLLFVLMVSHVHFNYHPATALHGSAATAALLVGLSIVISGPLSYPVGADYSRYLPKDSSAKQIVWFTAVGGFIPSFLLTFIGILAATAVDPSDFTTSMRAIVPGWFYVIFLIAVALGMTANNVISVYSSGLSLQALGVKIRRSRTVWFDVVLGTALTIYGVFIAKNFLTALSNFLLWAIYWWAPFFGIYIVDMILTGSRYDGPAVVQGRRAVLV